MITDAVLGWFVAFLGWVLDQVPAIPVPSWIASGDSALATVFGYAGSMGAWFPGSLALTVLVAVLGAWATAFLVKGIRVLASLLTGGGGSAG